MSIRQIDLVLKIRDLTDGQFKVLMYLADCARHDGSNVYGGPSRFAKLTGLDERTVRFAFRLFEQRGWIRRERPGGGRGRWPVYRLMLPGAPSPPLPFPAPERRPQAVEKPVEKSSKGGSSIPLSAHVDNRKGDPAAQKGDLDDTFLPVSDRADTGSTPDPSLYPSSTDQELPALRAGTPSGAVENGGPDVEVEAAGPTAGVSVSATLRHREGVLRFEGGELPDVRRLGGGRSGQGVELGVPAPDERTRVPGDRGSRGVAPAPEQIDALVALKARLFGGV